jgi:hypothetical protein
MFKTLSLVFVLFVFSGFVFAYDDQQHGNHTGNSYENGYVIGYQHGAEDVRTRQNFDFQNNNGYQNTSYNNNESCDGRVGYMEGYADGYFRHQARFQANLSDGYGNNQGHPVSNGYGNNQGYPASNGYGNNGGYSGSGTLVVAFTERGFTGTSQQFRVGQYSHLDGQMNDSIDSISVRGNVRVTLFDESNFGGKRIVLDRDYSDLGSFKSKAASMIIEQR